MTYLIIVLFLYLRRHLEDGPIVPKRVGEDVTKNISVNLKCICWSLIYFMYLINPFLRSVDINIVTNRTDIFISCCRNSSIKTAVKYDLVRRVRKIAKTDYWLRHDCPCARPSFRPSAWNNSAPTGRILIRFDILAFFENLSRKFMFH